MQTSLLVAQGEVGMRNSLELRLQVLEELLPHILIPRLSLPALLLVQLALKCFTSKGEDVNYVSLLKVLILLTLLLLNVDSIEEPLSVGVEVFRCFGRIILTGDAEIKVEVTDMWRSGQELQGCTRSSLDVGLHVEFA